MKKTLKILLIVLVVFLFFVFLSSVRYFIYYFPKLLGTEYNSIVDLFNGGSLSVIFYYTFHYFSLSCLCIVSIAITILKLVKTFGASNYTKSYEEYKAKREEKRASKLQRKKAKLEKQLQELKKTE